MLIPSLCRKEDVIIGISVGPTAQFAPTGADSLFLSRALRSSWHGCRCCWTRLGSFDAFFYSVYASNIHYSEYSLMQNHCLCNMLSSKQRELASNWNCGKQSVSNTLFHASVFFQRSPSLSYFSVRRINPTRSIPTNLFISPSSRWGMNERFCKLSDRVI